jgi:hypothetical protein
MDTLIRKIFPKFCFKSGLKKGREGGICWVVLHDKRNVWVLREVYEGSTSLSVYSGCWLKPEGWSGF